MVFCLIRSCLKALIISYNPRGINLLTSIMFENLKHPSKVDKGGLLVQVLFFSFSILDKKQV